MASLYSRSNSLNIWSFGPTVLLRAALGIVSALVLLVPLSASAQTTYQCPEVNSGVRFECSLGIPDLGVFQPGNPLTLFLWFFSAAMALTVILALTYIVIGGVRYVAGAGNAGQQTTAKETIKNALLGLVLALASTLILFTINPSLTILSFPTLDPVDLKSTPYSIQLAKYCACVRSTGEPLDCQTASPGYTKSVTNCATSTIGDVWDTVCSGASVGEGCTYETSDALLGDAKYTGICIPRGVFHSSIGFAVRGTPDTADCSCAAHDVDWCSGKGPGYLERTDSSFQGFQGGVGFDDGGGGGFGGDGGVPSGTCGAGSQSTCSGDSAGSFCMIVQFVEGACVMQSSGTCSCE